MKHSPWLMLILTACSTTPPGRTYAQMVPAAEPVYIPGAPGMAPIDAPHTTGMPGYGPNPRPPVSPHRRPLPPTEVPTLFGGDQPHAGPAPELRPILGVPPVFPASLDAGVSEALALCHARVANALEKSQQREAAERLSLEERRCLVPRLLVQCLEELQQEAKTKAEREAAEEAQQTPLNERRLRCGGDPWEETSTNTPAVQKLLSKIAKYL